MVLQRLARLFSRAPAPDNAADPGPLHVDSPLLAVGDVHGRIDLLDRIITRATAETPDATLVFVGDYIDRGEDSAAVLTRLVDISTSPHVVCLLGNHEDMLLDFLDDPEGKGSFWIRHGGLQTLASFGVGGLSVNSRGLDLARARDELVVRMGQTMIGWLRARPLWWQSGSVAVVHAAADPAQPLAEQARRNLLWGHRDFQKVPRKDGLWIVHGHTIVTEAHSAGGRIAIDTGAYATGQLTGAAISGSTLRFLTA
jgi:serine/threonine protein phosphatase 1